MNFVDEDFAEEKAASMKATECYARSEPKVMKKKLIKCEFRHPKQEQSVLVKCRYLHGALRTK